MGQRSPCWPVDGPHMIKGAHRDLIRSPKGSIGHPYWVLENHVCVNLQTVSGNTLLVSSKRARLGPLAVYISVRSLFLALVVISK